MTGEPANGSAALLGAPAEHLKVIRVPSTTELDLLYPREALSAGVSGQSAVACNIAASGKLVDCRVVGEEPDEMGFGHVAMQLARVIRLAPKNAEGESVVGKSVRQDFVWRAPSGR